LIDITPAAVQSITPTHRITRAPVELTARMQFRVQLVALDLTPRRAPEREEKKEEKQRVNDGKKSICKRKEIRWGSFKDARNNILTTTRHHLSVRFFHEVVLILYSSSE
jgi:hypothetical protein